MPEMNRRTFLISAATVAVAISLPVLQSRADSSPTTGPADRPVDVGPVKSFDKDGVITTWAKSNQFLIICEESRLYACTSLCTHRGAPLKVMQQELFCPRHKSHFTFQGTVTGGPAKRSLPRYAVSVDPKGHLIVDKSKQFTESQWDDPASFITVDKT